MNIIATLNDSGAPAGFAAAVQAACNFFDSKFTNNVTLNITFDWGGTSDPDAVAETSSHHVQYSYADVTAALATADAGAASDKGIVIPTSDPYSATNPQIWSGLTPGDLLLTDAQATALGLSTLNSSPTNTVNDATISLATGNSYNFSTTGGAVAGEYGAVSTFEHEISEVMGRQMGGNTAALNNLAPSALSLFRYSASGTVDTTANYSGGYFSLDGGKTNLKANMGEKDGDLADWGGPANSDCVGYAALGVAQVFTPIDMTVMEAIGWTPAAELAAGSGVSLGSPKGAVGGSDTITFSVTNNGQGSAGSFTVGIYISANAKITTSDTRIGSVTIDSLGYGQTVQETVDFSLPASFAPGAYHVGVIVDPDSQLIDANRVDNVSGTANITLTKPTFVWQSATSDDWSATGWGTGGNLAIPGAGDVADMSVTGSPYTVTVDNYTFAVSGGGTHTVTDFAVDGVILGASTTLEIAPNSFLLEASAFNSGDILIDNTLTIGSGAANAIVTFGADTGPGLVTLNDAFNGTLTGDTATTILTLHGQTVQGGGSITNMTLVVFDDSKIDATGVNYELTLNTGSEIFNNGVIEATGTSGLAIENETIRQAAFVAGGLVGVINASGSAAHVDLYSVHIEGGQLSASDQGVLRVMDSGTILDGSTSAGALDNLGYVLATGGDTLTLKGTIQNTGIIALQSGAVLSIDTTNKVVLTSSSGSAAGFVTLDENPSNTIEGANGVAATLDNVNNTISGSGQFLGLTLINEAGGVIDANGASYQLNINNSDTVQNAGLIEATGAAGLNVSGQTFDAKLGGSFAIGDGSMIDISDDTFIGGTFAASGTGKWVLSDSRDVLDGSVAGEAITNKTTLTAAGGDTLTVKGAIHNDGVIALQAGTTLAIDPSAGLTLDGAGAVTLDDNPSNTIEGTAGAAATLDNVNNTISGSGQFLGLKLINEVGGVIDATSATYQLNINSGDTVQNAGLIEATGAAGLNLSGQTIDAKLGGSFAIGDGSLIDISDDTFIGGTFAPVGTGRWVLTDSRNVLDGSVAGEAITNKTTLTAAGGDTLTLKGLIHNDGVIALQAGTTLAIDPVAGVTLDGAGKVTLDDNPSNTIEGTAGAAATLDNVNDTISGSGQFLGLTLINEAGGVIDATSATYQLVINASESLKNSGLIEATGAAGLSLSGQTVNSASGGVFAVGDGSVIDISSDTFIGGTFAPAGTGKWIVADSNNILDGSVAGEAITNKATLTAAGGATLTLKGLIHNDGAIALQAGTTLAIGPTTGVTLDGAGKVTLDENPSNTIQGIAGAAATLDNVNNTISGSGQFLGLNLINEAGGVIDAAGATYQLLINNSDTVQNSGLIEATGVAGLDLSGPTIAQTAAGVILAAAGSHVELQSASIIQGALKSAGAGYFSADSGASSIFGATLSATINVNNGGNLTLNGVVNQGVVNVDGGSNGMLSIEGPISGAGQINLADFAASLIEVVGTTTSSNAIVGAGRIQGTGGAQVTFTNKGLIDATDADNALVIATGETFTNNGVLEASLGATLTVDDAVAGTGSAKLVSGAISFLSAFDENLTFAGAGKVTLAQSLGDHATISGFAVGDVLDLLDITANGATLGADDVLTLTENGASVLSLHLQGAYSGYTFAASALSGGGVELALIPKPLTVAKYQLSPKYYDAIMAGFEVSDSASNIVAALAVLNADTAIAELAVTSGAATFGTGVKIHAPALAETGSSTALTIAENLFLNGAFTQGAGATVSVTSGDTLYLTGSATLGGTVTGLGALSLSSGGSTTIVSGAKISTAKWTLATVGAQVTLNDALTYANSFAQGAGTTFSVSAGFAFTLSGTATLDGAITGLGALDIAGGTASFNNSTTLSMAHWTISGATTSANFGGALLGYGGVFALGAKAAVIIASKDTLRLSGASNLSGVVTGAGTFAINGGAANVLSGASVTAANWALTGGGTIVAENLSYAGAFSQSATASLGVGAGDIFTLAGTSTLYGLVKGGGALAITGSAKIAGGGAFSVTNWSISGGTASLAKSLLYAGGFTANGGAAITLSGAGAALTLQGQTLFAGAVVNGAGALASSGAAGATTLSGLSIGGGVRWTNNDVVTEKNGALTLGDASSAAATLVNSQTGTYDLIDDNGVALGGTGSVLNYGLFEKTAGGGVSTVAPNITNTGTILAASGDLDLRGSVAGAGALQASGATLQLDGAVGASQTLSFGAQGGEIFLDDLSVGGADLFHGALHGWASGDTLDVGTAFGASVLYNFVENSGHTGGVLNVSGLGSNGLGASASITFNGLSGTVSNANFTESTDAGHTTLFSYHA